MNHSHLLLDGVLDNKIDPERILRKFNSVNSHSNSTSKCTSNTVIIHYL